MKKNQKKLVLKESEELLLKKLLKRYNNLAISFIKKEFDSKYLQTQIANDATYLNKLKLDKILSNNGYASTILLINRFETIFEKITINYKSKQNGR